MKQSRKNLRLSPLHHTSEERPETLLGLRLLWVVTLDPNVGEYHGAGMRFLNFSRELTQAGAQVYFAANVWDEQDRPALERLLQKLESDGVIAGSILTSYRYTVKQGRLGALAFYPGLTQRILKHIRQPPAEELLNFASQHQITAAIVSDRMLLFLGSALQQALPVIFDWTDSMALYYWRALETRVRKREWAGLFGFLRDYQTNLMAEAYYGRRAVLNTVVSPVDKAWLDRTNFNRARNRVWMNGTNTEERGSQAVLGSSRGAIAKAAPPAPLAPESPRRALPAFTEQTAPAQKIPKRLIFSGAMDYPPNYEGALWFIDEVFPLILKQHPEAQFVIAGVNPVSALLAKANDRIQVTGFVPDLGAEIACSSLYVAPLLSGGGFRNKVIESIMQGTYLIGTSISVEFLPVEIRKLLLIADSTSQMAASINEFFEDPTKFSQRLNALRAIVIAQFSWRGRTLELVHFLDEAEAIYAKRRAGKPSA